MGETHYDALRMLVVAVVVVVVVVMTPIYALGRKRGGLRCASKFDDSGMY